MSGRASAARYARALLDVAIKESNPEQVGHDLSTVASLLEANPILRDVLTHPVIPVARKRSVTDEILGRLGVAPPLHKLLLMLAERDRMALLPEIDDVYRERLLDHLQVVRAEVTTATPLEAGRAEQLEKRLSQVTGRRVTMTAKVDPSLIGGVVTRIGSTIFDGSVATRLAKMRDALLQER